MWWKRSVLLKRCVIPFSEGPERWLPEWQAAQAVWVKTCCPRVGLPVSQLTLVSLVFHFDQGMGTAWGLILGLAALMRF